MAVHLRWKIQDPADSSPEGTWVFPINPNRMNSPFPERNISFMGTTARDGIPIMWEGMAQPARFTFGGSILTGEHYEALRHWVLDRQGRLFLFDHFGRRMLVSFLKFDPEPKRRVGKYWSHDYTIECFVYSVSAPTVKEVSA